ncbi:hypothetical protein DD237_007268 [Peronospora effusa]|uniref:Uncharacterized protein n=1 Tax=Peronospora effusa TaxID=542832 RepID=A0A3R7W487_9STRA|nr:hypothetical protein DD237_007268 [Peronospora effusa]
MLSPSNSVIVVDDSSDDEPVPYSGKQVVSLIVSSSDESDSVSLCLVKKPRVASPTLSATLTDLTSIHYGSESELIEEKERERPLQKKHKSDTCEYSAPRGETLAPVDKASLAGQSSATIESGDDDTSGETAQLRLTDTDGRMYSDFISFSELQAQQREFERLQAHAHRTSKSMPHKIARRATAGSKRKASDTASVTHSRNKCPSMRKMMPPSPFAFDHSKSSDVFSFSLSSDIENHASASSVRAKLISMKDVATRERELARMCNDNAKKINQAVPSKKRKSTDSPKPSVPKPSLSPLKDQKNLVDETHWFDDNYTEADIPFQPEPSLEESLSKVDNDKVNDEEHMFSKPTKSDSQISLGRTTEQTQERGKTELCVEWKKSSKLKRKKGKNKPRPSSAKAGAIVSTTTKAGPSSKKLAHRRNARDTVMPGTVWRNVCFDIGPMTLLPLDSNVAHPFYSEFDCPLLSYDVDGSLRRRCKIFPQLGLSTQFPLSTQESAKPEQNFPQQDMDTLVTELIHRELPRLRACRQRKTTAILTEARAKVKTYLAAHEALKKQGVRYQTQGKRLGDVAVLSKSLLNQMKQEKLTQALSLGYYTMLGETLSVEEKVFPQDVNQLPYIRPLSKSTAYIGLKANIRAEDDLILHYKPYFGEDDDGADIDEAWYDAIGPKSSSLSLGLDGEVNECLLRLVVCECGTTDNVFSALKNVFGFAQAYSDYSEMKKLDDSFNLAGRRIKEAKELISRKPKEFPLAKLVSLEPSLQDITDCQKTLAERLTPPPNYFDSNLARHHSNRSYGLGLRSTKNYAELIETYRDMFCRMCYDYHCLEHGIEHPLPSHRVDPVYPPVRLSPVAFATLAKLQSGHDLRPTDRSYGSCVFTVSPRTSAGAPNSSNYTAVDSCQSEELHSGYVHTDKGIDGELGLSKTNYTIAADGEVTTAEHLQETRRSSRALTRICTSASQSLIMQGARPFQKKQSGPYRAQIYPQVADESEYLDDFYCSQVTTIVHQSQQADEKCLNECWKAGISTASTDIVKLMSDTELTLLRKLRDIIGDNPCLISSTSKSATCKEVKALLEYDCNSKRTRASAMDILPLSLEARSNHNGRKRSRALKSRSSSNQSMLNKTRNNCLKDRGANHEYEPCDHEGACDSTGCSCMTRDHTCHKACSCSRSCPNRFPGCKCSLGNCRTKACPCFIAARECNPDLCVTCGASEVPALIFDKERRNMSALDLGICCNVNILRGLHKKVGVGYSTTHGWGAFALEPIKRGEFIYEYHGALLSQDEAERRGSIYDKMTISFLFDVDDDSVVDAIRKGNKSKFANHSTTNKKCKGKVLTVGGEHRISIWAQQDIANGEELFFDYGYQGETAPDWSQLRIKGSARRGSKKKVEEKKKEY